MKNVLFNISSLLMYANIYKIKKNINNRNS